MPKGEDIPLVPWYERYPKRYEAECEKLEEAGFRRDEDALLKLQAIVYRGALDGFPERSLTVSFPVSYPSTAPIVQDDGKCELLRRHQDLLTRTYCIFGPKASAWCARLNAVDALGQIRDLCEKYGPETSLEIGKPKAEFPEPTSLDYSEEPVEYLLVPSAIASLIPESTEKIAQGVFSVSTVKANEKFHIKQRSVVTEVKFNGNGLSAGAGKYYAQSFGGNHKQGTVYFIPDCASSINKLDDLECLLTNLGMHLVTNREWIGVIIREESRSSDKSRYAWKAFHRSSGRNYKPVYTSTYRESENESRIPGYGFLYKKKVALIGCGSLGSKIAVALAASGLCKFSIFDHEIFEAHNSVRHECGVSNHGMPKIHALVQRLVAVNPHVENNISGGTGVGLGIRHADEAGRIKMLADCDLIIDATGNAQISRYLNEISVTYRLPIVYVSATNGGWSGEIMRFIPEVTPCWICYDHEYGDEDEAPPSEDVDEGDYVYAPGCNQPTFTGTTYDMGLIANIASGFIVDTLKYAETGRSQYEGDYLIWHNRDNTGRPVHWLETKATHTRQFNDGTCCQLCG